MKVLEGNVSTELVTNTNSLSRDAKKLIVRARSGVASYRVRVMADGFERELSGTIIAAEWRVRFFPWKVDPREDLAAWRKLAEGTEAQARRCAQDRFSIWHGRPA